VAVFDVLDKISGLKRGPGGVLRISDCLVTFKEREMKQFLD